MPVWLGGKMEYYHETAVVWGLFLYVLCWNITERTVYGSEETYIIRLGENREGKTTNERKHDLESLNVTFSIDTTHELGQTVLLVITAPDEANLDALREHPDVRYIQRNQIYHLGDFRQRSTQQDTGDALWGLTRITARQLPADYDTSKFHYDENGGHGVDVYVIDSGVNVRHEEFEGRAVHGYTVQKFNQPDFYDPDDPEVEGADDLSGHGTHVAGIIAGYSYGVAKRAKVIGVKACDKNDTCDSKSLLEALKSIYKQVNTTYEKAVINMATTADTEGTDYALADAIRACLDKGIPVVVPVGNNAADSCDELPGHKNLRGAIKVGATNKNDLIADYSNIGDCLDILAPGSDILSSYAGSVNAIKILSGTSMASAHVSGVLACYLSGISDTPSPSDLKEWLVNVSTKAIVKFPPGRSDKVNSVTPGNLLYMPHEVEAPNVDEETENKNLSGGGIAGIVCAAVIIVIAAIAAIIIVVKKNCKENLKYPVQVTTPIEGNISSSKQMLGYSACSDDEELQPYGTEQSRGVSRNQPAKPVEYAMGYKKQSQPLAGAPEMDVYVQVNKTKKTPSAEPRSVNAHGDKGQTRPGDSKPSQNPDKMNYAELSFEEEGPPKPKFFHEKKEPTEYASIVPVKKSPAKKLDPRT